MNNPVLNLNKLDLLRQLDPGGGAVFLKKLISIYLSSAPVSLEQIENAIQLADSYALRKTAHIFKSGAANMGAEKLAEICL
jgi:HPt (histidine-containing phosphotransfer) domain-containing protein